jgi:peptide deformylase
MIREIVIYGNPVLREKGALITEVTGEILALASDMVETMNAADGVGLAAHQVGVALQLAVVDVSEAQAPMTYLRVDGKDALLAEVSPLIFMNPKLEFPGKEKAPLNEGCLSFPELRAQVIRPDDVKATLTLLDGRTIVLETDGLFSRAIQHETDHLMGVLFIDRTGAATKLGLKKRIRMMQDEWGEGWTPDPENPGMGE